ncbi:MAG: SRPBCC domain-containing protein [Candidatus Methylacidiphilales bacterium]|nr:SRPBCC family protein [Candidatus Methylacidiphilales bacterium]
MFSFSVAHVYDAWLDPDLARQFLFATEKGEMVRADIDARVGGRFVMTDRRDGEDVEHIGHYLELGRPHRLVFTFSVPKYSTDSARVEITVAQTTQGTLLDLEQEVGAAWVEHKERISQGWQMILKNLDKVLAQNAS